VRTSLPALLRYEDRNSMAFSVEARTPFLDFRLVERALALPASDLVRGGWTKAVLRDGMAGVLPECVRLRRDKLGFATPEVRWLREIAPQVRDWLGPGARAERVIRPDVLARWRAEPDDVLAARAGLWRVLSVELWLRHVEGWDVSRSLRQRQTLASFDYQWGTSRPAMRCSRTSGSWPTWIASWPTSCSASSGAGSPDGPYSTPAAAAGAGRWASSGWLPCVAVDAGGQAVAATRTQMERLVPDAVAQGRLETERVDLLSLPASLAERRFDLVFSFGVLHHTGDTRAALANVAVSPAPAESSSSTSTARAPRRGRPARSSTPCAWRWRRCPSRPSAPSGPSPARARHPPGLRPPLADDQRDERGRTVEGWLREEGFAEVARTLPHTDLFLRAMRAATSAPSAPRRTALLVRTVSAEVRIAVVGNGRSVHTLTRGAAVPPADTRSAGDAGACAARVRIESGRGPCRRTARRGPAARTFLADLRSFGPTCCT